MLKTIISAWACAFIFLFIFWTSSVTLVPDSKIEAWAIVWIILLCFATTGSGWLYYRTKEKEKEKDKETR